MPPEISAPVQTLIAFGQKQATTDEVMRSLISHHGWLAPAMMFAGSGETDAEGRQHLMVDKKVVILSTEISLPADELWIFTDRSTAERAREAGAKLGIYAEDVTGIELFRKIDHSLKIVRVNPFSPTEQTWQFKEGSYELARLWAEAIALEESFLSADGPDIKAIGKFEGFAIFNHASGYVITLPNQGRMTNPAAVFTTPDCTDAFWAILNEEQRAGMSKFHVDGMTLLKELPLQKIDGIYFNPFGPGQKAVFSLAEIEDVSSPDDKN